MKRMLHLVVVLVGLFAIGCAQPPQALTEEEVAAVREVFDAVPRYINAGEYASFANEVFTERGMLMPPNEPTVSGRAAIQAWAEQNPGTNLSFADIEIRGTGALAWGSSSYTVEFEGAPGPDTGKQLVVLVRQEDDRWWVVAVSFSSDLPIPEPPTS